MYWKNNGPGWVEITKAEYDRIQAMKHRLHLSEQAMYLPMVVHEEFVFQRPGVQVVTL